MLGHSPEHLKPMEDGTLLAQLSLPSRDAADLAARLRGIAFGGRKLVVDIAPPLPRSLVRAARTEDARRRRRGSPGFSDRRARLDDEGRMSLTPEALALAMAKQAPGTTVVDACCGAGGNAIAFAREGQRVCSVEISSSRVRLARENASLYGVAGRIDFIQGDAAELLPSMGADLLFIDPPWGEDWNRELSGLNDLPLLEPLLRHRARFSEVWIKVPPSFDPAQLPGFEPQAMFGVGVGDAHRVKFLWMRTGS